MIFHSYTANRVIEQYRSELYVQFVSLVVPVCTCMYLQILYIPEVAAKAAFFPHINEHLSSGKL